MSTRARRKARIGGLARRGWRRLERRARAAYAEDTLAAAQGIEGTLRLAALPSGIAVVRVTAADRALALGGASLPACDGLAGPARVEAAGRYGQGWWIRLRIADRTTTVLGSVLQVNRIAGGDTTGPLDSPTGGESILVPCEPGSPSATSPG